MTDAIKQCIMREVDDEDFVLCEIGGTVGDIEGLPFLEAIRQLGNELGHDRIAYSAPHPGALPRVGRRAEDQADPALGASELRGIGIQPDLLLCRAEQPIPPDARRKIALFCNVRRMR